ncbi:ATP-binding protein [Flavobacteriaceae bacterium S356]|uniref:ATP-binding protein n=1 Tax=Asprobacillus argus TaxID=3076534 RepID=A0ABU3LCV7_9FLAO|nr:ATP-binding protein [Flavobacteriaceae bacterium S356]
MQQKIVLIGGPGTGKSSVLNELIVQNYYCMPEVSREVTLKAQQDGIDQLFLTDPILFSKLLLEGREQQFITASETSNKFVFFDRGLPDVYAYLKFSNTEYPSYFKEKCIQYKYDKVFQFSPWEEIYITDNERYETFEESKNIDIFLKKAYKELGYSLINVPFGTIKERTNFIINSLKSDV